MLMDINVTGSDPRCREGTDVTLMWDTSSRTFCGPEGVCRGTVRGAGGHMSYMVMVPPSDSVYNKPRATSTHMSIKTSVPPIYNMIETMLCHMI